MSKVILLFCFAGQLSFELLDTLQVLCLGTGELFLEGLEFDLCHFEFYFFKGLHRLFLLSVLYRFMILKSLIQLRKNIGQAYHKLKITRLPGEEAIVMLNPEATVG